MFQALAAHGISSKGLQTLDHIKTPVKTEHNQSVEKACWSLFGLQLRHSKPFSYASYSDIDNVEISCSTT